MSASVARRITAGIVSAATVLGVGHLVAAVVDPAASPLFALGAAVVDRTPHTLKDAAIRWFGSNDKTALFATMAAVMLLGAAVLGLLEHRRPWGTLLLTLLGLLVTTAALQRPTATPLFAIPTLVGTVAGALALHLLTPTSPRTKPAPLTTPAHTEPTKPSRTTAASTEPTKPSRRPPLTAPASTEPTKPSRRAFLTIAAGAATLAVGAATAGQWLGTRLRDVTADRARFRLPRADSPAPAPGAARVPVPGVTGFITPADRFYRVDTALQLPALTSSAWRLRIHGMADRTIEFDFDRLRSRQAVERTITLTCVSNEVGGDLAGTAVWTGYPLADLLREAGPHPDADMLLSRSIDGFTASTPLSAILDGRDALLAVGMNGAPLPVEHGYPARLIVPGLYGYVSATKWVVDLELTRFDRARAYWTQRGWAADAPIKTASRIDVPAAFATVPAGVVTVAGVAWAQHRGIDAVEIQVDDAPWQPATLAAEYSKDTWRQWFWRWDASPGTHTLRVRARDRDGVIQTDHRAPPFPDGATGWHSRVITVR
ncbi:molybdopterin-dependent oxidoreductase [Nocardia sp. NPDC004068]|uniref:molybdopterin-dependent oxidoreductase n=1 Tax=Nocardia sp. NPDC004068 TaxID=3364303 RepID=UPI0036AA7E3D